jgi:hypothetical protein
MAAASFAVAQVLLAHERDRHGPVFRADVEGCALIGFDDDAMHLVVVLKEVLDHLLVRHVIAGVHDLID